jgi:hypothetical protein
MVPAALAADEDDRDGDWICLECEETGEPGLVTLCYERRRVGMPEAHRDARSLVTLSH